MEYSGMSTSESTTLEIDFCLSFIGGAVIEASEGRLETWLYHRVVFFDERFSTPRGLSLLPSVLLIVILRHQHERERWNNALSCSVLRRLWFAPSA